MATQKGHCKGSPSEQALNWVNKWTSAHLIVILGLQEAKQDKAGERQGHTNSPVQELLRLDGWPGAFPTPLVCHMEELWGEAILQGQNKATTVHVHTHTCQPNWNTCEKHHTWRQGSKNNMLSLHYGSHLWCSEGPGLPTTSLVSSDREWYILHKWSETLIKHW